MPKSGASANSTRDAGYAKKKAKKTKKKSKKKTSNGRRKPKMAPQTSVSRRRATSNVLTQIISLFQRGATPAKWPSKVSCIFDFFLECKCEC